jgi:hypothetical protein
MHCRAKTRVCTGMLKQIAVSHDACWPGFGTWSASHHVTKPSMGPHVSDVCRERKTEPFPTHRRPSLKIPGPTTWSRPFAPAGFVLVPLVFSAARPLVHTLSNRVLLKLSLTPMPFPLETLRFLPNHSLINHSTMAVD